VKGVVFIILNEMIEEKHGIEAWEDILSEVNPESEGIYVATESYSDEELMQLVLTISSKLDLPTSKITSLFGHHLFGELNRRYPMFAKRTMTLFEFLDSIENVIHQEVRKLYMDASLPTLSCTIHSETEMTLTYKSPRKLCFLAEGLIHGAAEHYEEQIVLDHPICMHKGDEMCELRIKRE